MDSSSRTNGIMGYLTQALNRQRPLIRMDSSSRTNDIMGYLTQAPNRQRPWIAALGPMASWDISPKL